MLILKTNNNLNEASLNKKKKSFSFKPSLINFKNIFYSPESAIALSRSVKSSGGVDDMSLLGGVSISGIGSTLLKAEPPRYR